MHSQTRIAVVEDQPEFRKLLVQTLQTCAGWSVVAECRDGASALAEIPATRPDLVLLDLLLPGNSGVSLIPRLRSMLPRVRVVVLTVVDSPEQIVAALEAGACGYILKGGSASELLARVEEVLVGGAAMSSAVARRLVAWFQQRQLPHRPADFGLTGREWEVLRLAARGKQQGEIAQTLGIALNTVKNHFRNIYDKLGVGSFTDALVKINDGRGLLDGR
jgi:DNA-binding NarL/FixJ family response regulator